MAADPGEEALIILESLLCVLRERNVLNRADIEALCRKIEQRAAGTGDPALPCPREAAAAACTQMQRVSSYIGHRYGGKHARELR